jgi:acetyl-CoA decarbonylase/synthase complex subunit gamma
MALTGIQIFKLLPKTNCGECGVPTCLAFAMNLAAGKAELTACPYVSEEARAELAEASAPPIRPLVIGTGDRAVKVGGETVLFRHEKRFENPTGIAMLMTETTAPAEVDIRLERAKNQQYERVGLNLRPELLALKCESGDAAKFTALVSKVVQGSDFSLILMSDVPDILAAGLKVCADKKPLLYAATSENAESVASLAKEAGCPVAARASDLEELDQVWIRMAALNRKFRPLGFPTIVFPCEMTDNPMKEALIATLAVAKYGGIIVLSDFQGESLFPLLVARMNIYTDPQRPLASTEGIYEIGSPNENSPVLLTSNFSLTYFLVSGEIESSKVPAYLLVQDTEGLSVMTAWAAGKFVSDAIAPFVKKSGIADKVKHHKLVIPGYLASESGGLEEELEGWEIQVGPREGAHIPAYLKAWKP